MAEAIVSVLTERIFEKLISLVSEEIVRAWGFEAELRKLETSLSSIRAVLEDAEMLQVNGKSERIWLRRLIDVSYDVDDVLDEVATELHRQTMETRTSNMEMVSNFFLPSTPIAVADKIKDINKKLDEIRKDNIFQFRDVAVSRKSLEIRKDRQTHSFFDDSTVVGRDIDKANVVKTLISSPDSGNISVLPIVGMGGLGKTTLARLVYHDESVKRHFDLTTWICVTDHYDLQRVIKEITESATKTRCDNLSNLDTMASRLQDTLSGKRFLLVLDDLWNDDHDDWETLKNSLGHGADRESKILVTTRNNSVATTVGTLPTYHLELLSKDQCWPIFRQRAFGSGGVGETPFFVKIGREIVKKCKGLPLAAKTLGGLMSSREKEIEWVRVRDSDIWNLPANKNNKIIPALKLSYEHLPPQLKRCFAYCSIFPKDHLIEKDKLIKLWMAEGFVQPSQGSGLLEDIANEYFNDLLWRSFFQDVEKDEYGDIELSKMHDLVHDLAQSVSGDECSIVHENKLERVDERTRYLSFACTQWEETHQNALDIITEGSSLRTFVVLNTRNLKRLSYEKSLSFKCLRVLDLYGIKIDRLSPSVGELIHLRYFGSHVHILKVYPRPSPISVICRL